MQKTLIQSFICLFIVAFLYGCGASRPSWHQEREKSIATNKDETETATSIPRADPGFIQQLEKRSMLHQAFSMAKIVSGSSIGWGGAASSAPDGIKSYADAWLFINPNMMLVESRSNALTTMSNTRFWAVAREAGLKGIFVAPTGGSGAMWHSDGSDSSDGDDVAQYKFAEHIGTDDAYRNFISKSIDNKSLVGGDMVPAATGLGPDFFLASRNVREYPGIYCLIEVPEELWPELPATSSKWAGSPISKQVVSTLSAKNLLPAAMLGDSTLDSGWAATTAIAGIDGQIRRWVYRYNRNPNFAVLNWEDPSRAANRILSGSVVRQVGMQGQSLIGLKLDAFHGLEAGTGGAGKHDLGPALSAGQSMSREVKRYGGWAWQRDNGLSIGNMRQILNSDVDFVTDNALSPAAEHALLTGDSSLLRYQADKLIASGINTGRLVHSTAFHEGLSYTLPTLSEDAQGGNKDALELLQKTQRELAAKLGQSTRYNVLYTTSAGLAASALGLSDTSVSAEHISTIAKGQLALHFFKAMQPGLFMVGGQDLVGALPLPAGMVSETHFVSRGAYSLSNTSGMFASGGQTITKARTLYAPADEQVSDKKSFVSQLGKLMEQRRRFNVSKGTLIARPATKNEGVIAILSRLHSGKGLLTVVNFSQKSVDENIDLGKYQASAKGLTAVAGTGTMNGDGGSVLVSLPAWGTKAALITLSK